MDIYAEEVMDHYENPRNQGEVEKCDLEGRDANASCGDMIQFSLKIERVKSKDKSEKSIIKEMRWKGVGCAITTAAASKLSEWLQGQSLKVLRKMSEEEMVEKGIGFTVNPGREKCLTLPVRVVKKLLSNTNTRNK